MYTPRVVQLGHGGERQLLSVLDVRPGGPAVRDADVQGVEVHQGEVDLHLRSVSGEARKGRGEGREATGWEKKIESPIM